MKVQQDRASVQLMLGLVLSSTHLCVNIMKTRVFQYVFNSVMSSTKVRLFVLHTMNLKALLYDLSGFAIAAFLSRIGATLSVD